MTIPMMPGWWDQIKDSVQSLGMTGVRAINPNFDNQLALSQFIRQNPANQQAMIDAASLNPQMFAQMYGQNYLQNFQGMGSPSVAAQTEMAGRQYANTPIRDVPDTLITRGASRAIAGRDVEDVREADQRNTFYTQETTQKALEYAQQNAVTAPRVAALLESIRTNPGIALINPLKLAEDVLSGRHRTDANFAAQIDALATVNPTAYQEYKDWIGVLSQQQRDEAIDERQRARDEAVMDREDARENRQAQMWALKTSRETGLNKDDLLDYALFQDTPGTRIVENFFGADESRQQQRARLADLGRINGFFSNMTRAKGADKDLARNNLGLELSAFFSLPNGVTNSVSVEEYRGDWLRKTSRYRVNGIELDGEMLNTFLMDPLALRQLTDQVNMFDTENVTPDQLRALQTTYRNNRGQTAEEEKVRQFLLNRIQQALTNKIGASARNDRAPRGTR